MFYFTFGVTVIAVRSVVLINDNDYDMMMIDKYEEDDEDDYDDEEMIVEVY